MLKKLDLFSFQLSEKVHVTVQGSPHPPQCLIQNKQTLYLFPWSRSRAWSCKERMYILMKVMSYCIYRSIYSCPRKLFKMPYLAALWKSSTFFIMNIPTRQNVTSQFQLPKQHFSIFSNNPRAYYCTEMY